MSPSKRILIVEDEMMIALHIETTLTELGHKVVTAMTTADAEKAVEACEVDLALVDYKLTDGNSEPLMERLHAAGIPFVVCSGMSDEVQRWSVSRQAPFLAKPFSSEALVETVTALLGIDRGGNHVH